MDKIRIGKVVFWKVADKTMSGKIKKIMSSHAVIDSNGLDYIVRKDILSTTPTDKIAKMAVGLEKTAALVKTASSPEELIQRFKGVELEFDLDTGERVVAAVNGENATTEHPEEMIEIFNAMSGGRPDSRTIQPGLPDPSPEDFLKDIGEAVEVKQPAAKLPSKPGVPPPPPPDEPEGPSEPEKDKPLEQRKRRAIPLG